jgi:cation transport ATPase
VLEDSRSAARARFPRAGRLRPAHAHRFDHRVEDVSVAQTVGDTLWSAPERSFVDGIVISPAAIVDESMLTGELPAAKVRGASASQGTLNAGETFELMARRLPARAPMRASCA